MSGPSPTPEGQRSQRSERSRVSSRSERSPRSQMSRSERSPRSQASRSERSLRTPEEDAQDYLEERNIDQLFRSLTVGLLHHRPSNPVDFLLDCLDHVEGRAGLDNAFWDTFLPRSQSQDTFLPRSQSQGAVLPDVTAAGNAPRDVTAGNAPRDVTATGNAPRDITAGDGNVSHDATGGRKKIEPRKSFLTRQVGVTGEATGAGAIAGAESGAIGADVGVSEPKEKTSKATGKKEKPNERKEKSGKKEEIPEEEEGGEEEADDDDYIRQQSENTHQTNYTNPKAYAVMCGALDDLPPMPTNTVRIFLSSTFSDFKAERNALPERAFPSLQEFCGRAGLDFQVVDMRWGVTDEMMNDHQVSALCLQEIVTCRQVSCGPTFVALLGNRYGYRPFPASIPASEFSVLRQIAGEMESAETAQLLTDWFRLDDNSCPAEYVLQPIVSRLPHYNNHADETLRQRDARTWNAIHDKLRDTLRACATRAVQEGKLEDGAHIKYTISVTEEEITEGLLCAKDAQKKALCYVRQLQGIEEAPTTSKKSRFIDTSGEQLDKEACDILSNLKLQKIPPKMQEGVYQKYTVPWKGELLEESADEELEKYLDKFCQDFVKDMETLITKHLEDRAKDVDDDGLYLEVLHHSKFAEKKIEVFCGRDYILNDVRCYLSETREKNEPVIIHGPSGYGKTSVMAKIASLVPTWKGADAKVVTRFLGTSPQSSDVLLLLRSVMAQICGLFGYTLPPDDRLQKMGDVRQFFNRVLAMVGEMHAKENIIILLDSIDQLSPSNGAHHLTWLPTVLPPNIHIILSLIPDRFDCLANAKRRVQTSKQFIQLEPLSDDTGDSIIDSYLKLHRRTVTSAQKEMVKEVFKNNRQPLFLKLVLDAARKWNSYTDMSHIKVVSSVIAGINTLFEEMETMYGSVFVSHALGYLTCGRDGLSGIEMEDVLSCDDEVLDEVYRYHDPPLDGIVRIPSLLWSRLQHQLKDYIAERQVDGKTVMTWYHRQFWEVAEERYLSDPAFKQKLHRALAELYGQETGIKRTVTLTKRGGKVIESADRKVTPQKLSVHNLRKLNSLPYHLFHGELVTELKETYLLNFEFLLTKLRAVGINQVFNEYGLYFKDDRVAAHKDVVVVKDFLEKYYSTLNFDPRLLALTMKETLLPYAETSPAVSRLCQDATTWFNETTEAMFVPHSQLNMPPLSSPLKFSLLVGSSGCLAGNDRLLVLNFLERVSKRARLKVLDLETKDVLVTLPVERDSALLFTQDSEYFFHTEANKIQKRQAETGDFAAGWTLDEQFEDMLVRQMSLSHSGRYLAVGAKCGKPKDADSQKWRQSSLVALINLEKPERPVTQNKYFAKKHVDKLIFVENDEKLICLARERVTVYSLPELVEMHVFKGTLMNGAHACCHELSKTVIIPVGQKKGVQFLTFDYGSLKTAFGPAVHVNEPGEENVNPFGLAINETCDKILMGSRTNSKDHRNSFLWLWQKEDAGDPWTKYEKIPLGVGVWKVPNCLVTKRDFSYCLIGWYTGDLSVVDLEKCQELYSVQAHGKMVNQMYLYQNETQLLSVAEDQGIRTWDVGKLLEDAVAATNQEAQPVEEGQELDMNEQVLDLHAIEGYVLTAGWMNKDGPKFWHVENAQKDHETTAAFETCYRASLPDLEIEYEKRYHGSLTVIQKEWILYSRKRRNAMGNFSFSIKERSLVAAQWIPNSYMSLALPDAITTPDGTRLLIQGDGELYCKDFPQMTTFSTIQIPKITDDIPNRQSSSGKTKLQLCKLAVTADGRFAIFANPNVCYVGGERRSKYFDVMDLPNKKYIKRCPLPDHIPWKFLDCSIYFYIEGKNITPGLFTPSMLPSWLDIDYQCLLYADSCILSDDLSLGVEILKGNGLRVWETKHMQRVQKMEGHVAEITCGRFSPDKQFLATGSYDFTTRLWSIETGQQLCLFHSVGSVDKLMFTPSAKELIIQHYSAPQRKRASVMGLRNVYK